MTSGSKRRTNDIYDTRILIPAINCPSFTTVYYITGGNINFIKRTPLAHRRSTTITQLPWLSDNATGKK